MQFQRLDRREFMALVGAAAAAWPLAARAQQSTMPVVGYLDAQAVELDERRRAFRRGLKDNGFVEGENVLTEYRFGGIRLERVPELLDELVRRRVAVIVVTSGPVAVLAAKASTTIPIVFLVPEDPVRLGLVASLARPGGNMTGINFFATELVAKRLGLLREMVPGAARVAVLVNPAETVIAETTLHEVHLAARAMGLQIQIHKASTNGEINEAFGAIARDRPDALFVSSGPFFGSRRVQLANLASRHAIPAMYGESYFYRSRWADELWGRFGGSISPSRHLCRPHPQGRQARRPAGRAVTKFEMVINAQTARMLVLDVPDTLLARADEVIE